MNTTTNITYFDRLIREVQLVALDRDSLLCCNLEDKELTHRKLTQFYARIWLYEIDTTVIIDPGFRSIIVNLEQRLGIMMYIINH